MYVNHAIVKLQN